MKIAILIFTVLGMMWFMFYVGLQYGKRIGSYEAKGTYIDSAMRSDSIRWVRWNDDQADMKRRMNDAIRDIEKELRTK